MLESFAPDAPADAIAAALDRDGAAVVLDYAKPELVGRLMADLEPQLDAEPWCNLGSGDDATGANFFGERTKRLRLPRHSRFDWKRVTARTAR